MGTVVPFPRTRDRDFVWRQARRMVESKPRVAENWLAHILGRHRETMSKRGIAAPLIAEHVSALEAAIRCEMRDLLAEGGAA